MTTPAIAFRPLATEDMQRLFLWLLRPHVAKWYSPAPGSFMEMLAKYGPRTQPGNVVRAFIIQADGADVGYIQTYAVSDFPDYARALDCGKGVAAVDLFIGEDILNRGVGSRALQRFVDEIVFADAAVKACIANPAEGNRASIRAFEKAGFATWKAIRPEAGEPERVLRKDRAADTPRA